MEKLQNFINGELVSPSSGKYLDSVNPHDKSIVYQIADSNADDIDAAVTAAKAAQQDWADMNPMDRGMIMHEVARALRANIKELIPYVTNEMGAPQGMVALTLEGAAKYWDYYAGLAPSLQGTVNMVGPEKHSYTTYEPYGAVGIITPWNVPLNQASRGMAPALAVGNSIVLKPSEYTSASAVKFAEIAYKAGLPKGVFNVVTGAGSTGADLVNHPAIGKISFTGSVPTGQKIFKAAADKIMPVSLELGGKSPDIVFEDADMMPAVQGVVFGLVLNTGQVCSAGTRILIQESIYDKFSAMLAAACKTIPIGLHNQFPCLGPLANEMQYNKVMNYMETGVKEGGEILTGGKRATGPGLENGFYVEPTLFGNMKRDMTLHKEEIFGPVGVLLPFKDEAEAIEIANDTEYGLVAGVWTQNLGRAHRVASKIDAGQIWINYYVEGGVEHPFGGFKKSGIGREKGVMALKSYCRVKTIVAKIT